MTRRFIDAVYLVALVNPRDQWHNVAVAASDRYTTEPLVTTEDVLTELLNFYAESGPATRTEVAAFVRELLVDVRIEIVERSTTNFLDALDLYESRPDKGYSLTDCISMNVCRELGIAEVLTADTHFEQEGFVCLL